jgi:inner membrane transporter RhtA
LGRCSSAWALLRLVLLALWHPRLSQLSPLTPVTAIARPVPGRRPSRRDWRAMLLFGLTIAAMNSLFYLAIACVLLGIGVTAGFIGPLTVALLASACWGMYILLNVRVGRALRVVSGGASLLKPGLLLIGLLVAILSSFIPFSLELEAPRRLPARVFGVLMSLEPAMATLIGWVAL